MNLLFFASFMLFIIWLTSHLSRRRKNDRQLMQEFWEKESRANQTRRKSLDSLSYITIPLETLPLSVSLEDEIILDCVDSIKFLSGCKIVNLTGITNTELKLQYGAPNLLRLMEYDQNYTKLARTLQKWAARLKEFGFSAEACTVLEFAVSTGTDISATYVLLADLYRKQGYPSKVKQLITAAQGLHSGSQQRIVRILQESDPYNGSPDCG